MLRRFTANSMKTALLLILGVTAFMISQRAEPQTVVTHPSNPLANISESTLRAIFGMRLLEWPDGTPITVYVLDPNNLQHNEFCKNVLHIFPYQLQRNWNRLIFSGSGQAPESLKSSQEMLERIQDTPGAIGYLPEDKVNDKVRILSVQ